MIMWCPLSCSTVEVWSVRDVLIVLQELGLLEIGAIDAEELDAHVALGIKGKAGSSSSSGSGSNVRAAAGTAPSRAGSVTGGAILSLCEDG